MTTETIKALLMVAMFGGLEAVLHFPRNGKLQGRTLSRRLHRVREAVNLLWPTATPTGLALQPLRAGRHLRRR